VKDLLPLLFARQIKTAQQIPRSARNDTFEIMSVVFIGESGIDYMDPSPASRDRDFRKRLSEGN
jgi:Tat protein secretion system quality control protein TatD with DNase activity